jgi:hypothetical protein
MPADTKPPDLRFATVFERLKDCSAVVVGAFLVVRRVTPYGIGFGDVHLVAVACGTDGTRGMVCAGVTTAAAAAIWLARQQRSSAFAVFWPPAAPAILAAKTLIQT